MATTTLPAVPERAAAPEVAVATETAAPTRRSTLLFGAALAASADVMLFAGLIAAFLLGRSTVRPWPAKGVHLDNYRGNIVVLTAVMAAAAARWSAFAARRDDQRNTVVASAMSLGLGLALLDVAWYTVAHAGFAVSKHTYAGLWFALVGTLVIHALGGVLVSLAATVRAIGGQVTAEDHDLARIASLCWFVIAAECAVTYYFVWVVK